MRYFVLITHKYNNTHPVKEVGIIVSTIDDVSGLVIVDVSVFWCGDLNLH